AYRSQKRAGFEADKWEIMVVDVDESGTFKGKPRGLTAKFDDSVGSFVWDPDSTTLYLTAEVNGSGTIYSTSLKGGNVERILAGNTLGSLSLSKDGNTMAMTRMAMNHPNEIYVARGQFIRAHLAPLAAPQNVSNANAKLLAELDLPRPESVKLKVDGAEMQ